MFPNPGETWIYVHNRSSEFTVDILDVSPTEGVIKFRYSDNWVCDPSDQVSTEDVRSFMNDFQKVPS